MRFIAIVLTAFLDRVKPVSSIAKPTCMNITRNPPTSTQARLSDGASEACEVSAFCACGSIDGTESGRPGRRPPRRSASQRRPSRSPRAASGQATSTLCSAIISPLREWLAGAGGAGGAAG